MSVEQERNIGMAAMSRHTVTNTPQEEDPGRAPEGSEESDEGTSDMEEVGTDAMSARLVSKKKQHTSYQDAGDSD